MFILDLRRHFSVGAYTLIVGLLGTAANILAIFVFCKTPKVRQVTIKSFEIVPSYICVICIL